MGKLTGYFPVIYYARYELFRRSWKENVSLKLVYILNEEGSISFSQAKNTKILCLWYYISLIIYATNSVLYKNLRWVTPVDFFA